MYSNSLRPEDTCVAAEIDMINFVGYHRTENEDNCCINSYFIPLDELNSNMECTTHHQSKTHLYGVFDGVGGDASGEIASLAAAHFFASMSQEDIHLWEEEPDLVRAMCCRANEDVTSYAAGSATTMVLLGIANSCAYTVHLGDSRAYLLRRGQLRALTSDHTAPRPEAGERSHCITRFLGAPLEQEVCLPDPCTVTPLEEGDVFLLCSDGLTDMVDEQRIQDILMAESTSQHQQVIALVKEALSGGGLDNITAMLIRITGLER